MPAPVLDPEPAPAPIAPAAAARVVYFLHLSGPSGPESLTWYSAYLLTPTGLEIVWPEDGREAGDATMLPLMRYRSGKSVVPFAFCLDGGNYDKPHELAQALADHWRVPVEYGLLTGYSVGLRIVRPST